MAIPQLNPFNGQPLQQTLGHAKPLEQQVVGAARRAHQGNPNNDLAYIARLGSVHNPENLRTFEGTARLRGSDGQFGNAGGQLHLIS